MQDTANFVSDPLNSLPPAGLDFLSDNLECSLIQVGFSDVMSVEKPKFAAAFQERLRREFPFLRQDSSNNGSGSATIWRHIDLQQKTTVSLARGFLALESRDYRDRSEFFRTFRMAVNALAETVAPGFLERIGVRYISRTDALPQNAASPLIRPEFSGLASAFPGAHLALNEVHMPVKEGGITLKHGKLPPGMTIDASVFRPRADATWLLDVDAYRLAAHLSSEAGTPWHFNADETVAVAEALSLRAAMIARSCGDGDETTVLRKASHPTWH